MKNIIRGILSVENYSLNEDGTYKLVFKELAGGPIHHFRCTKETLMQQFKNPEEVIRGIGCDWDPKNNTLLSDTLYANRFIGTMSSCDWQLSFHFC